MRVGELERLLVEHGAGVAKLNALTRRLRELGRLRDGGLEPNDAHLNSQEAAAILLALAGSTKGPEADLRLRKLEDLQRAPGRAQSPTLLGALAQMLEQPRSVSRLQEVRVGRTGRQAAFVFADGHAEEFRPVKETRRNADKFRVEGVLPAGLLWKVADALSNGTADENCAPTRT